MINESEQDEKFIDLFVNSKKDDLADAYLRGDVCFKYKTLVEWIVMMMIGMMLFI